ncbi:MAG: hypothetical protein NVSMB57_00150 [Actinomycetota bacterium]
MWPLRIQTERLTLVACSAEMLSAAMHDRAHLAEIARARIPLAWPDKDLAEALPLMVATATADPSQQGWLAWLIIFAGEVVGDAGTHGKPVDGQVEIGFSVLGPMRRRGIGREAVRALCTWLSEQPDVSTIFARVEESNLASKRVLESAGMRAVSQEGRIVRYELRYD